MRRWELLSPLEGGHLKEWLASAGDFEYSSGEGLRGHTVQPRGPGHCCPWLSWPSLPLITLAVSQLLHCGSQAWRQAPSMVPLKDTAVTGFLFISVGKLRHRPCVERWGARHGTGPTPRHHQGLPAWGVTSVCSSFPAPAPGGPQASTGGAGGGLRHALTGELAAAFPLLTQSQPACWAFRNHRSDKNTIKPVLLRWRGWVTRPPQRRDCG